MFLYPLDSIKLPAMKKLALIILVLLFAPAAEANTPQENAMLLAASTYYGTETSCPANTIEVLYATPPSGEFGEAPLGGCWSDRRQIELGPIATLSGADSECMMIAHEYGHLIGLDHSTDPNSPMYPTYTGHVIPQCWPFHVAPKHHRHHGTKR